MSDLSKYSAPKLEEKINSQSLKTVSVLFAREDSVYKTFDGCDVWDIVRDALRWPGGNAVVTHPPCRAWASLRHCAKPRNGEKGLALFALDQVRRWGGVLEHPLNTTLWREAKLPSEGNKDIYGGFTLIVDQFWFGHRARKRTRLYVCGCFPKDVPIMPIQLGDAPCTVGLWSGRNKATCRPSIVKKEYESSPRQFAQWLVELARKCHSFQASIDGGGI